MTAAAWQGHFQLRVHPFSLAEDRLTKAHINLQNPFQQQEEHWGYVRPCFWEVGT